VTPDGYAFLCENAALEMKIGADSGHTGARKKGGATF